MPWLNQPTVYAVRNSIFRAVHCMFHTQPSVNFLPVVVTEATLVRATMITFFTRCFAVFFWHRRVILPWIANILETGDSVVIDLTATVTVVYADLEGHLYIVDQVMVHIAGDRSKKGGTHVKPYCRHC